MKDCLFCQIAKGKLPAHKVWEDKNHLAFLSIFPNTDGFTVVATKEHYPSNFTQIPEETLKEMIVAAQKVAKKLIKAFPDTKRVGLVIEGEGVNHFHFKLIPMHPGQYKSFLTTKEGPRADDQKLVRIAKKIRASE